MTTHKLWIGYILFSVLLGGLFSMCANPVSPSGGPKDATGPKVLYMFPENGKKNFEYDEIHIYFDEYLKQGAYGSEIFISPIPTIPPEIIVKSKGIVIRFNSDLMENTTYVITVGTGIQDANEGNKLKKPITYAFSTGDELDSLTIKGRVTNPQTGGGEKEFTVLLFDADSVANHDIWERKPIYAAKTDEQGNFKLSYLARKRYHIYAIKDGDQDYTYSSTKESIALAEQPLVEFDDSSVIESRNLYSFLIDEEPPRLKSVKWINDLALLAEFKENIRPAVESDSFQLFIQDTLGNEVQELVSYEMIKGKDDEIFIFPGKARIEYFDIRIVGLQDSLGNRQDTLVRVEPESFNRKYKDKVYFGLTYSPLDSVIRLGTSLPIRDSFPDLSVEVVDTGGKPLTVKLSHSWFQLITEPQENPTYGINYKFKLKGNSLFDPLTTQDTLPPADLRFPDPDQFGTLRGSVKDTLDSLQNHQWILYLRDDKSKIVRSSGSIEFYFPWLKPGKYSFLLLDDEDGNGCWTPGSLDPYRMPEQYYTDPEAIDVKAKWDVEEWEVYPRLLIAKPDTSGVAPTTGKGGKGLPTKGGK